MIRTAAMKLRIGDVLNAPLSREEQTVVITIGSELVSRVNVIGTIVSVFDDSKLVVVNDGTGQIPVQWFDGSHNVAVGDTVLVIGRIREFNNRYIFPQVLKKITDTRWLALRKQELDSAPVIPAPAEEPSEEVTDNALKLIHESDRGDGADMDEVIEKLGENGEEMIKKLLMAGEIFES
jgi:hypothetical protein